MVTQFYDKSLGQVSAIFKTEVLEDWGLFNDENLFNYQIRLSIC